MKQLATAVLPCLVMGAAGIAPEATAEWHITPLLSAGRATIDDSSHGGTIGTGQTIGGIVDGTLAETTMRDTVAGIGLAIGHPIGALEVEAELTWRYRTDWDLTASTPSINTVTNVFSNVENTSLLVNAGRGIGNLGDWHFDVGAGAGLAYLKLTSDYIERAVPGIADRFDAGSRERSFEPAWNIYAGASRTVGSWQLGIRYRFIDLGDLATGAFNGIPASATAVQTSHEIQVRLRRR